MYFKFLKSLLEVFYSTPPSSIISSIQEQMIDILYFIMHSDINLSIQNYYKLLNIIDMYAPAYDLSKITLFLSSINIFYNIFYLSDIDIPQDSPGICRFQIQRTALAVLGKCRENLTVPSRNQKLI